MRDIEGIDEALAVLEPRWVDIEAHFNVENERFKALMGRPHDTLGKILKCHLVVENYLDRFLTAHYKLDDIEKIRLSFYQKAQLLPNCGEAAAFAKPGVVALNVIRNRFGHNIDAEIRPDDLNSIHRILRVSRPKINFGEPIEAIEAFTTVACSFLIVPPPELQGLFIEAFSKINQDTL